IPRGIKKPKIVACTDGVGTKVEIANLLNKYDTLGIDLVAMSVNDLIVQGAQPILFLDYISINKIILSKLKSIIKGIKKGCEIANCELVGGETAEMPGTYEKGKFDVAGFAVGVVDEDKILDKRKIKSGDLILAIPSSGIHSNGYSLVRHVISKKKINIRKNSFLKQELLKPTKIYVNEVLNLNKRKLLNGCANITGGGLSDNIKRIIPDGFCANIDLNTPEGVKQLITTLENPAFKGKINEEAYDALIKSLDPRLVEEAARADLQGAVNARQPITTPSGEGATVDSATSQGAPTEGIGGGERPRVVSTEQNVAGTDVGEKPTALAVDPEKAFEEGKQALLEGKGIDDHPYGESEFAMYFQSGWLEQERELQSELETEDTA
ncbi:MAG: phosphoribosylformylglycinamidine cyclo-ligase, partial [Rhodobacterales bacterium]|nr:phosphoribosylformylglycinamidine cyclo-ligase [Rhodobacterales bacterium]